MATIVSHLPRPARRHVRAWRNLLTGRANMAQAAPLIIALVCILGVIGLAALRIPVPDVLLVGTGMAFGHFLRDVADVAAGRPPAGG